MNGHFVTSAFPDDHFMQREVAKAMAEIPGVYNLKLLEDETDSFDFAKRGRIKKKKKNGADNEKNNEKCWWSISISPVTKHLWGAFKVVGYFGEVHQGYYRSLLPLSLPWLDVETRLAPSTNPILMRSYSISKEDGTKRYYRPSLAADSEIEIFNFWGLEKRIKIKIDEMEIGDFEMGGIKSHRQNQDVDPCTGQSIDLYACKDEYRSMATDINLLRSSSSFNTVPCFSPFSDGPCPSDTSDEYSSHDDDDDVDSNGAWEPSVIYISDDETPATSPIDDYQADLMEQAERMREENAAIAALSREQAAMRGTAAVATLSKEQSEADAAQLSATAAAIASMEFVAKQREAQEKAKAIVIPPLVCNQYSYDDTKGFQIFGHSRIDLHALSYLVGPGCVSLSLKWWRSQLSHYGLPDQDTISEAKEAIKEDLHKLKVPEDVQYLSDLMKVEYEKRRALAMKDGAAVVYREKGTGKRTCLESEEALQPSTSKAARRV